MQTGPQSAMTMDDDQSPMTSEGTARMAVGSIAKAFGYLGTPTFGVVTALMAVTAVAGSGQYPGLTELLTTSPKNWDASLLQAGWQATKDLVTLPGVSIPGWATVACACFIPFRSESGRPNNVVAAALDRLTKD